MNDRLLIPNTCQVPNVLLDSVMPKLGGVALKVLLVIVRQTYGFNVASRQIGLDRLSKLAGLSKQGVLNGIKELGALITVKRGPRNSRVSNEYGLNIDISTGQLVNKIDLSNLLTSQKNTAGLVKSFDSLKPSIKPNKSGAKAPSLSSPSAKRKLTRPEPPEPAMLEAFNRFYQAFPRQVARQDALTAWAKLNPTPDLQVSIMTAVGRYAAENESTEQRYILHPDKWLKKRRWEDEPTNGKGAGNDKGHHPVEIKDLGDGFFDVDGVRMDERTVENRYGKTAGT